MIDLFFGPTTLPLLPAPIDTTGAAAGKSCAQPPVPTSCQHCIDDQAWHFELSPHSMDKPASAADTFRLNSDRSAPLQSGHHSSPARSDRSDDSEGRPVREKLKETRIDGQEISDQTQSSEHTMDHAAANATVAATTTSGSDNERGRLRRKRSREDFEDEPEDAKHQGKKHERHHARKKSRDITSPVGSDVEAQKKKANGSVTPIAENSENTNVSSAAAASQEGTVEASASVKEGGALTSPKNKRKLEHTAPTSNAAAKPSHDPGSPTKAEGRDTKRPRDGGDSAPVTRVTESKSMVSIVPHASPDVYCNRTNRNKASSGGGFSNTSAVSPFASMASKSTTKPTEVSTKDLPQTSSEAFKSSGFGAFASSSASPFATASKSGSSSPFGATAGNALSSFASKPSSSTSAPSAFASVGGSTSSFSGGLNLGNSTFGGALGGSAFGSVLGGKPTLSTFGGGGSITGLKQKAAPEFGAAETQADSDNDDEEDGDDNKDNEQPDEQSERRASQPLLSATGPPETGEENEDTKWTGRAKLYAFVNHDGKKSWQERGKGPLKLNVTREGPHKARFVLRADGTHRLLLNAAITTHMKIGDASGNEPKDGRLLFNAPTATGEVDTLMLSVRTRQSLLT